jgi:hypothetical protein
MGRMTLKSAFASLVDKLNCFSQGASPLAGRRVVIAKTIRKQENFFLAVESIHSKRAEKCNIESISLSSCLVFGYPPVNNLLFFLVTDSTHYALSSFPLAF